MTQPDPDAASFAQPIEPRWHQSFALAVKSIGIAAVGCTKAITSNIVDSIAIVIEALTKLISAFDAGRANFAIDIIALASWAGMIYLFHESMLKVAAIEFYVSAIAGFFILLLLVGWCLSTCYLKFGQIKDSEAPKV